MALLLALCPVATCQASDRTSDCSTLKYTRHKVSCLCGVVDVCAGDICGGPSVYELDDDITVELRDKSGTTLDTQRAVVETVEEQGTTQDLSKTSFQRRERRFSFDGKQNGSYVLAFILHKDGVPQPALIFPIKYSRESHPVDRVYMLEPICPK